MLSQTIRRLANQVPKIVSGRRAYRPSGTFNRGSGIWGDFFGQPSFFSDPFYDRSVYSTYEKQTVTNKPDGRVVVKTVRKSPGRPWERFVEEYADESANQSKKHEALENTQKADETTTQIQSDKGRNASNKKQVATQQESRDLPDEFMKDFEELSTSMSREFDDFFGIRSLFGHDRDMDRFFHEPSSFDSPNANYHFESVVNDNGKVTVKTAKKIPGRPWETSVKSYQQSGAAVEGGQKKTEAIAEGSDSKQKTSEQDLKQSNEQMASEQDVKQTSGQKASEQDVRGSAIEQ